jgi:hypothetical protein
MDISFDIKNNDRPNFGYFDVLFLGHSSFPVGQIHPTVLMIDLSKYFFLLIMCLLLTRFYGTLDRYTSRFDLWSKSVTISFFLLSLSLSSIQLMIMSCHFSNFLYI